MERRRAAVQSLSRPSCARRTRCTRTRRRPSRRRSVGRAHCRMPSHAMDRSATVARAQWARCHAALTRRSPPRRGTRQLVAAAEGLWRIHKGAGRVVVSRRGGVSAWLSNAGLETHAVCARRQVQSFLTNDLARCQSFAPDGCWVRPPARAQPPCGADSRARTGIHRDALALADRTAPRRTAGTGPHAAHTPALYSTTAA